MRTTFEVSKSHLSGVAIAFQKAEGSEMVVSESENKHYKVDTVFTSENRALDFFYQLGTARVEVIMSKE